MIDLHAFPYSPNAEKIHFFLEAIEVSYSYHFVDLLSKEHKSPDLTILNPKQRIPFLLINDQTYTESQSILRYLASRFAAFDWYPEDLESRNEVDTWMEFNERHIAEEISILMWENIFSAKLGIPSNSKRVESAVGRLGRDLPFVESHLASRSYFAGVKPTLADVSLLPAMSIATEAGVRLGDFPNIEEWLGTMEKMKPWSLVTGKRSLVNWNKLP